MAERRLTLTASALAAALALSGAMSCSSKDSTPDDSDGTSNVDLLAGILMTSDVKYIDIKVTRLSDHKLMYYSGIQPAVDGNVPIPPATTGPWQGREYLERVVSLAADTDYLFDATAYPSVDGTPPPDPADTNTADDKFALTVQQQTLHVGQTTKVLIVIDLNPTGNNNNSGTDITAVTDNFPVMDTPSLSNADPTSPDVPSFGNLITLTYTATDADIGNDPLERLIYFTTVLSNGAFATADDGTSNYPLDLFAVGDTTDFYMNGPMDILAGVTDRFGRVAYQIMHLDPSTSEFEVTSTGEGYAVFTTAPDTIDAVVLKIPPAIDSDRNLDAASQGTIQLITRATTVQQDDGAGDTNNSTVPDELAFWNGGKVESFNAYETEDDAGNITELYKLRVGLDYDTSTPPVAGIIDTVELNMSVDGIHMDFFNPVEESGATIPDPAITAVDPELDVHGDDHIGLTGSGFTGVSMVYFGNFDLDDGTNHFSTVEASPAPTDTSLSIAPGSNYAPCNAPITVTVFSYGRRHTTSAPYDDGFGCP